MHILLVASAFNSLTQRVQAELKDHGHSVAVQLAHEEDPVREAVRRESPDLVVAPYLKTAIPRDVWSVHTCLVVHPGPIGDRGPSSLDWAVHEERTAGASPCFRRTRRWTRATSGRPWPVRCPRWARATCTATRSRTPPWRRCSWRSDASRRGRTPRRRRPPAPAKAAAPCSASRCVASTGSRTPPRRWSANSGRRTPSPVCSTGCWAASGSCTVGIPSPGWAGVRGMWWPPGTARSAGRPPTARCGSPSCGHGGSPAARPPSSSPPPRRWPGGCPPCPSGRLRRTGPGTTTPGPRSATGRRPGPASCRSRSVAAR